MKQQLLCLIYYYYLVCFLLIVSNAHTIYLLLSCYYLSYHYQHHYFYVHHHSLHFYNNFTNFLISQKNVTAFYQIINWHNNIKIFCTVYKCVTDFSYAWPKCSIILEGYLFIASVSITIACTTYSLYHNNICITTVPEIWS